MKTCSFRGARTDYRRQPGLFCRDAPQAQYGMIQCQQRTCHFCFPLQDIQAVRLRQQTYVSVVKFSSAQKHRFLNGYEAILNCPTVRQFIFSICERSIRLYLSL